MLRRAPGYSQPTPGGVVVLLVLAAGLEPVQRAQVSVITEGRGFASPDSRNASRVLCDQGTETSRLDAEDYERFLVLVPGRAAECGAQPER